MQRIVCLFLVFLSNLGFHQVVQTCKGTIKLFITMSNVDSPSILVSLTVLIKYTFTYAFVP